MKMVANYLISIFHIKVKRKFKYKILSFAFQFIKNTNGTLGTQVLQRGFEFL